MRFILFFTLFLTTTASFAQAEDAAAIHVTPLDPNFPAQDLNNGSKNVVVDKPAHKKQYRFLPQKDEREKVFSKSGVSSFIKDFDELDRDHLWLRAKEMPAKTLAEKYPMIPATNMSKLVKLVKQEKIAP